jgi:hypothetical protein
MTPEEREALTRERRGLRPDERLPRPEGGLFEGEGHSSFEEVDESGETPAPPRPVLPPGFRVAPRRPVIGSTPTVYILDEDWTESYSRSETFQHVWQDCHDPDPVWPNEVQLVQAKLYQGGKLCVPENRGEALILAFHVGS